MSRVKTGTVRHARHKKILDATKGYRGANNRLYKRAKEAFLHAGAYAYAGRRLRRRDLRSLWIVRINGALQTINPEFKYSRFIAALKKNNIAIDRKILADLTVTDFNAFKSVVTAAGLAA